MAFGLDWLSEWWVTLYLVEQGPMQFHPLVTVYPTFTRRVAFGLVQGIGSIVGWLSIVIAIGLLIYLRLSLKAQIARKKPRLKSAGTAPG